MDDAGGGVPVSAGHQHRVRADVALGPDILGFFSFTGLPQPIDWALIGALAATAGSGGIGNLTVTNWVRDKGFGMGAKVGAIPSAVGGHPIQLTHSERCFPRTPPTSRAGASG